ncbi:unnamed protein product [Blepharisma stoltei]|uniref:Uncharacterized protein n=1 Tax=Blepharisma stoltei TaxID=1481888 RepID=A0AAU9JDI2_9CILI|nr:unnamed protein product [Blepharisma stoltei]
MNENFIVEQIDISESQQNNTNTSEKNPSDLINELLMSEMFDEMYTGDNFLINQTLCDRCKESIEKNRKITYEKEIQTDIELPQKRAREEIPCERLNKDIVEIGGRNGEVFDITSVPVARTLVRPPPAALQSFSMMPPTLNYMPYNPLNRPYMPTIPLQQRPTFSTKYPEKHVPLRGDILNPDYSYFP